jgi:hypothetical protein
MYVGALERESRTSENEGGTPLKTESDEWLWLITLIDGVAMGWRPPR